MRPNGLFKEYEEVEDDKSIEFKGVLKTKYEQCPKSQLALRIAGVDGYKSYEIEKNKERVI